MNNRAVIIYYILIFCVLVGVLQALNIIDITNQKHFLNADAIHYYTIKETGYVHYNQAFFPLFPMLWSIIDVAPNYITIVNASIYLVAFGFLVNYLKSGNLLHTLLYLTIPSAIFYFLPFSEAVFFASSTLILIGLNQSKASMVYLGLFLACISRPAFTVLLPGLLIVELLNPDKRNVWLRIIGYFLSAGLGLLIVTLIQHHYTGEWLQFLKVQKYWGNELGIPSLPLRSWGDDFIARTDGTALLFGGVSGVILLLELLRKKRARSQYSSELILSLAYSGGISLMVFLFRDGSLFSLNRFVFATPFAIVVIHAFLTSKLSIRFKHLAMLFFALLVYWLLFGSYVHIQTFLKYAAVSFIPLLFLATKLNRELIQKGALIVLIATCFVFQIIFFVRMLNELWVA